MKVGCVISSLRTADSHRSSISQGHRHHRSSRLQYLLTKLMLTVFWDANGVAHSWFVLSGTTVNSEWCCETVGKLEVGPHMTVFDSAQVRDKLHTFDALFSPSWIAHHLGLTWCRQSFISFTKWRNILQDITTGRTMKSRQRLSCGYVIKIRSSVVTDLTEIPEIWQKRVGRPRSRWVKDRMDCRASSYRYQEMNPDRPACSVVTILTAVPYANTHLT